MWIGGAACPTLVKVVPSMSGCASIESEANQQDKHNSFFIFLDSNLSVPDANPLVIPIPRDNRCNG
jgi:hypothetical protein